MAGEQKEICRRGGGHLGLILPITENEADLDDGLRGVLYGIAMAYFFLGVSIVADIFMGAIEAITSRKQQVRLPNGKIITTRVWNDTVANLTLMALGSSAPEILLSVIELFKNDMVMGELGPQTIVGSAAFNLFMIVGLCVFIIPSSEVRKVQQMEVFVVTTVFMMFAYLWLVVSISGTSPGVVDSWEAGVTLLGLPLLVAVSFWADIGGFSCESQTSFGEACVKAEDVSRVCNMLGTFSRETRQAIQITLAQEPQRAAKLDCLTPAEVEDLKKAIKRNMHARKSRAARRVEATRELTGGKRVAWDVSPNYEHSRMVTGVLGANVEDVPVAVAKGTGKACVQFASALQSVSAELCAKQLLILRSGEQDSSEGLRLKYVVLIEQDEKPSTPASVARWSMMRPGGSMSSLKLATPSRMSRVATPTGTGPRRTVSSAGSIATTPVRYRELANGRIAFEPAELQKYVTVAIPKDATTEGQSFVVELRADSEAEDGELVLGGIPSATVQVVETGSRGRLRFAFEQLLIQGTNGHQVLEVVVQRLDGCSGTVSCTYRTERLSAVPGHDYNEASGTLEFLEGVTEQIIEIEILPKGKHENKDEFLVLLEDAFGGACFSPGTDGGLDSEVLTVTIGVWNALDTSRMGNVIRHLDAALNFDALRLGNAEWWEALTAAFYCNGSREEQQEASALDWAFHAMSLPWKLFFVLIPPVTYFHGWACFWFSLFFIAGCTAVIGDLAELFGCVMGVPDTITAIVFVALGTSMPDLFASKTAATQDPDADASIVNVTGSNSVNVFLGLGLPWTVGAVYWECKGSKFVAPTAGLSFSVGVFVMAASMAIILLLFRRRLVGAELGGPFLCKVFASATFMVLWCVDVTLVAWHVLRADEASSSEQAAVYASCISVVLVFMFATAASTICCRTSEGPIRRGADEATEGGGGRAAGPALTADGEGRGQTTAEEERPSRPEPDPETFSNEVASNPEDPIASEANAPTAHAKQATPYETRIMDGPAVHRCC